MTTESAGQNPLFGGKDKPNKSFLVQVKQRLKAYFEMPPPELSTLPERMIALTRIRSWPLASLIMGLGLYLIFLIMATADGFINQLQAENRWWYALILPVTGIYLLLIEPVLRYRLTQSIDAFRQIVPFNDRFKRLETYAYTLNRRSEWIAFIAGTLVGWFILEPPLRREYFSTMMYDFLGDILVFGMSGWHIYAALARTRVLTSMYEQAQNLTILKNPVPFNPILRWSIASAATLLGGIGVSAIFVPRGQFLNPTTVFIYSVLSATALLVFVFSKVPTSLLNQFRVVRAFFLFLVVAVVGSVGFNQFEGWSLSDSLYATIITMTTIGYGDYSPSTYEGRIFTIFLSLFAIGIGGYAITSIASFVIEGNFHRYIQGRRVDKKIVKLRDHYIICGAGKLGRQAALEFYKSRLPFVVIELSPAVIEDLLHEGEFPYVQGDATQDETLRLAGVGRAKGLVAALSDDKDNVFIALSARSMNPNLRIISRLSTEKNRRKLAKAGADDIISPNAVSGRRMASEMLNSEVVTLLDEMLHAEQQTGQTLRLEEVHVDQIKIPVLVEQLNQENLHVRDIGQRTELMVVAIKRCNCPPGQDPYIYTPRGDSKLYSGDVLIVLGTPQQRIKLQQDVLSTKDFRGVLSKLWA